MNAPLRTGQLGEREVGPPHGLPRSLTLRAAALAGLGMLLSAGPPSFLSSRLLFLTLVGLLVASVLMLTLVIYRAGRR